MKTKHYYDFGGRLHSKFQGVELNKGNWDALRMDAVEGSFSLERSVEEYEENCEKSTEYKSVAEEICHLLASEDMHIQKIISLGVGKGVLEYHLKKMMPECIVECTDYTEQSLEQLKKVFQNVDSVYPFDILEGDYSKLDTGALFIMYRISTEFCLQEWYDIFEKIYEAGVSDILFIPTGLDSVYEMMKENVKHIVNTIRGRKDIQCGWLYSENEFMKMFRGRGGNTRYTVQKRIYHNGTAIFLLKRN